MCCVIDVHPSQEQYDYSNVIEFISQILNVEYDPLLLQMFEVFDGIRGLAVGCYDEQTQFVQLINPGRLMVEAVYSIEYDGVQCKVDQQMDFIPVFLAEQPETGDHYVLVRSELTSRGMLDYIKNYIDRVCDPKIKRIARNISAGYLYL